MAPNGPGGHTWFPGPHGLVFPVLTSMHEATSLRLWVAGEAAANENGRNIIFAKGTLLEIWLSRLAVWGSHTDMGTDFKPAWLSSQWLSSRCKAQAAEERRILVQSRWIRIWLEAQRPRFHGGSLLFARSLSNLGRSTSCHYRYSKLLSTLPSASRVRTNFCKGRLAVCLS